MNYPPTRRYCWAITSSSLWITGQDPRNGNTYIKLGNQRRWQCRVVWDYFTRAGVRIYRRGSRQRNERERFEKGHREKGISVCMALKLINRDETASVIKAGNVGAYVTSYFIQLRVCVCVFLRVWNSYV